MNRDYDKLVHNFDWKSSIMETESKRFYTLLPELSPERTGAPRSIRRSTVVPRSIRRLTDCTLQKKGRAGGWSVRQTDDNVRTENEMSLSTYLIFLFKMLFFFKYIYLSLKLAGIQEIIT